MGHPAAHWTRLCGEDFIIGVKVKCGRLGEQISHCSLSFSLEIESSSKKKINNYAYKICFSIQDVI
jgi:hypothetical protein